MGVDDDVVAAAVAEAGFLAPFFLDAAMFWQSVWSLASTEAWSGPREAAAVAEAGFLAPFFLDARGSEGAEPEAGPVPREADLRHPLAPVPLPHSSVCSALLVLLLYTLCFASSSSALNPSALLCSVCSEYGVCSAFPNIRLLLSFM